MCVCVSVCVVYIYIYTYNNGFEIVLECVKEAVHMNESIYFVQNVKVRTLTSHPLCS